MSGDIFAQLSTVIVIAAAIAYVTRLFKQPMIVAYILAGILIGPSLLHLVSDTVAFEAFSQIGIALLLFIIGLELSFAVIKRTGKPVFLTAMSILFTVGTIGFLIGLAFHFTLIEAILIGLAMFFSSTIIIAKMLSDKREITRLNGQIAVGVILFDDIVATFALLFVSASSKGDLDGVDIALLICKGILTVCVLAVLSIKVLPRVAKAMAKSQELLFLFALAWGFGVASVVNLVGFSVEIGALFAGVSLAHLPYAMQIGARLKPLRDFFLILFFISLGEHLVLTNLMGVLVPALIMSVVVLAIKPVAVMLSLGLLGYTKRTSFKTGVNLSQISEFSIILIVLAASSGVVSGDIAAIITLVALITITISAYFMQYDDQIYRKLERYLNLFERSTTTVTQKPEHIYPLVLVGYRNGGHQYLKTFRKLNKDYVVVDYDPDVIEILERASINYLYGDASDPELLAELNPESIEFILNTVRDHNLNLTLARYILKRNPNAVMVCYSSDYTKADELYKAGVSYVILPHFIGSEILSAFISSHGISKRGFDNYRERHLIKIGRAAVDSLED